MAYTTLAALSERYGVDMLVRATDRAEVATGQIDVSVVEKACTDATALIDGYLAARYTVPMSPVPPLIATLAEDVAIYKLHPYQPGEKIVADYEAAMRALRDIAGGKIRLPTAEGLPEQTGETGARVTDRARPFTEDNMKSWI